MILCNLAVLMAQRGLKITRVALDTGISRTTLTSLCNNYSQGIQFETMDTLCLYFDVQPDELISFMPIGITLKAVEISNSDVNDAEKATLFFEINESGQRRTTEIDFTIFTQEFMDEDGVVFSTAAEVYIDRPEKSDIGKSDLYCVLDNMPVQFNLKLSAEISAALEDKLDIARSNITVHI